MRASMPARVPIRTYVCMYVCMYVGTINSEIRRAPTPRVLLRRRRPGLSHASVWFMERWWRMRALKLSAYNTTPSSPHSRRIWTKALCNFPLALTEVYYNSMYVLYVCIVPASKLCIIYVCLVYTCMYVSSNS